MRIDQLNTLVTVQLVAGISRTFQGGTISCGKTMMELQSGNKQ